MKRSQKIMLVALFACIGIVLATLFAHASTPVRQKPKHVAAPVLMVNGGTQVQQVRIAKMVARLNFSQVAMVSYWQITILDRYDWDEKVRKYHIENETSTGFTVMQEAHTFLREDYLVTAPDLRVRQTVAHEAGHLICECGSESKADEIAAVLQRPL